MRIVFLAAAVLALSCTVAAAKPAGAPPAQAQTFNRDAKTCTDPKLEPKFLSDWWYDLNAASAERRISDARHEEIEKRMLALANELGAHNAENNPALLVAFCQKLNLLRPHWSRN